MSRRHLRLVEPERDDSPDDGDDPFYDYTRTLENVNLFHNEAQEGAQNVAQ